LKGLSFSFCLGCLSSSSVDGRSGANRVAHGGGGNTSGRGNSMDGSGGNSRGGGGGG